MYNNNFGYKMFGNSLKMDPAVEKKVKYESLIQDASKAYLAGQYNKASCVYNDALVLSNDLRMGKMIICILKYMICRCLLESNKLEDLAEVVMILQTLDKEHKKRFPAVYCLLAKAHCKLYRFDYALDALKEADALFNTKPSLEAFYIPGTNITIEQNQFEKNWLKVKEECSTYHPPDAICSLIDCNCITKPYVTPNRNIFKSDPAFNGMVIIHCNNKQRPCLLKFHQYCWKHKKDQLYPLQKISDKDIVGNMCFTPNCMNDSVPCTISYIEIIDKSGETKALIKESTSAAWPAHKNSSKGAIKKVKLQTPKKIESPTTPSKQHNQVQGRQTVKQEVNRFDGYDDDQILAVKNETLVNDFSHESPNIAVEKCFLFSLFYDYIEKNLVRVCDVYSKFVEIKQDLVLKDLDILTFLLESNKIEVLDNKIPISNSLLKSQDTVIKSENTNSKMFKAETTQDIDDVYYELTNDDNEYTNYDLRETNLNQNIQKPQMFNENVHENYQLSGKTNIPEIKFKYEAGGGDASSDMTCDVDKKLLQTENLVWSNEVNPLNLGAKNINSAQFYNMEKENKKFKEYIAQLEKEQLDMKEETHNLEKQLRDKNSIIESLEKERDNLKDSCETLYETIAKFQKKYESVKEENIKMKEEMITLHTSLNEAKEREATAENDSKVNGQDFMKTFQKEYKILEDCINSEWENKLNKLEENLQTEIETKMSLLNKSLNYQYSGNKHLVNGLIDQCTFSLEIINKVNSWMEKVMNIKNLLDNSEWMTRLHVLQKTIADHQNEYSALLKELHSDSTEKFKMTDIGLSPPSLPGPPRENPSDLVVTAFNSFYNVHCQIVQNLAKASQPISVPTTYQMPSQNFSQYRRQLYQYGVNYSTSPPIIRPHPAVGASPVIYPVSAAVPQMNGIYMPMVPQGHMTVVRDSKSTQDSQSAINNTENISVKSESTTINDDQVIKKEQKVLKSDDKNSSKIKDNHIENLQDRIAQMKKAFKAIAVNVKEKSAIDSASEDEETTAQQKKDDTFKEVDCKEESRNSSKLPVKEDDQSDCNTVITDITNGGNISKTRKKIGTEALLKKLMAKYPGSLELDLVEIIMNIRKNHNNSLSGISLSQIFKEAEEYFTQMQRLHVLRYFITDGSKQKPDDTCYNETHLNSPKKTVVGSNKQNLQKEIVSPASSCNSLNKLDEGSAKKKKAWNTITHEEIKWTASGEIECSICMALVKRNNCYTLSCRHAFHTQCIKPWLKSDRSCPNCRAAVTEDDEFPPLPA